MPQLSGEALLISALINVGNVDEAVRFGISPEHFRGYKDHYNWLLNYVATYGEQPTKDIFLAHWKGFPFSEHADVRSAADLVFKATARADITEAMSDAVDLMSMGDVHAAYTRLTEAKPRTAAPKPVRLLTDMTFFDTWESDKYAIEVPYRTLMHHTGGIKPGNLWYWAARPGQGKTAHLCNIVTRAVLDGCRVKFYSLEMSEMEVRARFHAALATHFDVDGLDMQSIRDRRIDLTVYKDFIQTLDDRLDGVLDIHTPRDGIVTPTVVEQSAEDYHLNVVDYIGLMRADDGTAAVADWRVAASISNRLKEIPLARNTAVLAASQINREGEAGANPPKIANLAQSDALAQDGDVVVTMRAMAHNVATTLSLEKNRHGPSGVRFYSLFNPNKGIYTEVGPDQVESLILEAEVDA